MRTGFEINGDYRLMDSAELVYILTNSAVMVNKVQEKEIAYGENCNFEEVLAKMTPGKRNLVMAGVELYKRCNSKKNEKQQIKCSTDIYDIMHPYLCDNKTEECWAIFLNQSSRVTRKIRVSAGGYAMCPVDVRVILKEAILCEAVALIICHNHPSGNCTPSRQDIQTTKEIELALSGIDVILSDHFIFTDEDYLSMRATGVLQKLRHDIATLKRQIIM